MINAVFEHNEPVTASYKNNELLPKAHADTPDGQHSNELRNTVSFRLNVSISSFQLLPRASVFQIGYGYQADSY